MRCFELNDDRCSNIPWRLCFSYVKNIIREKCFITKTNAQQRWQMSRNERRYLPQIPRWNLHRLIWSMIDCYSEFIPSEYAKSIGNGSFRVAFLRVDFPQTSSEGILRWNISHKIDSLTKNDTAKADTKHCTEVLDEFRWIMSNRVVFFDCVICRLQQRLTMTGPDGAKILETPLNEVNHMNIPHTLQIQTSTNRCVGFFYSIIHNKKKTRIFSNLLKRAWIYRTAC